MTPKQMHMMRMGFKPKGIRKGTPLAKEIELRREEMIKGILGNSAKIIEQQMRVASLPVAPDGPDNDTVLKASNALLDRAFGKPKESIDFTGNVQFSLKELAAKRKMLTVESQDITPLEDMLD